MKEFTVISASDLLKMPRLSESELKAQLTRRRAAYRKSLRELCPSKETRQKAKRISKRNDSCETCVYCDGETWICHYPHSDLYMENMNIDPCYEGVLRHMVKAAKEKQEAEITFRNELYADLSTSPEHAVAVVMDDLETLRILCGWIISMIDDKWDMPPLVQMCVREFYDILNEALPPSSADSIGVVKNGR